MLPNSFDRGIFFSMVGLTIFGLVMMSSMSIASSFEVTGKNDFYFWRHFFHIIISIPLFVIAFKFPYEQLRKISPLCYIAGVVLLLLTLVLGNSYGTAAKSWLDIGVAIQPVEFMKPAIIVFLAAIFSSGRYYAHSLPYGLIPFCIVLGIPAILIILQPDYGSLLVIVVTACSIFFMAGASLKHMLGGMIFGSLATIFVVFQNEYILHRVKVFFNPDLDPLNTGFQVKQALIAIGSGGIFGKGFQNSIQKFDYLPEVQSDTIFSAIAEEMGFVRIILLISVYLYIGYRGFKVAKQAPNEFTQLCAIGLTTWIVGQAFINIAVNMALLPNTGITLPLISAGGSSLISTIIGFGLLLHISQYSQAKKRKHYGGY